MEEESEGLAQNTGRLQRAPIPSDSHRYGASSSKHTAMRVRLTSDPGLWCRTGVLHLYIIRKAGSCDRHGASDRSYQRHSSDRFWRFVHMSQPSLTIGDSWAMACPLYSGRRHNSFRNTHVLRGDAVLPRCAAESATRARPGAKGQTARVRGRAGFAIPCGAR